MFVTFALLLIYLLQTSIISNALKREITDSQVDDIMQKYRENYSKISEQAHVLKNAVFKLVEKMAFVIPPISTFRVKNPDSLSDKLNKRKRKGETNKELIEGLYDIVGFRFTCFFPSIEIERIIKELNASKNIEIIEIRRTGEGNYNGTNIKASFKDFKFEIQLRGAYQHAFYEIFHDFGYKAKINLTEEAKKAIGDLERLTYEAEEKLNILMNTNTVDGAKIKNIVEFPRVPDDGYDGSFADDDQNDWYSLHSILTEDKYDNASAEDFFILSDLIDYDGLESYNSEL